MSPSLIWYLFKSKSKWGWTNKLWKIGEKECGGLSRDARGAWFRGFTYLGKNSVLGAKLFGYIGK